MSVLDLASATLLSALLLSVAMTIAWAVQHVTGNSGWIDTIWSASVGLTAALLVVTSGQMTAHRWVALGLVTAWSARLATHIGTRTLSIRDDPRYRALIKQWGNAAASRLWLFLQAQAAVGVILVASVVLVAAKAGPMTLWDAAVCALALLALAGEATADAQLRNFKARNAGRNAICDTGLWALSRHPNYFFEWLFWLAIALLALTFDGPDWSWLALLAPTVMYIVLVYGSGVPHSEAQMLRTRGARFAEYQARVPMFFPDLKRMVKGAA